ncbi:hypothetical protein [Paraburkholderia xenovorans]
MQKDDFAAVLSGSNLPRPDDFGGLSVVLQRASDFVKDIYAERLVEVLGREGASAREAYLGFALRVLGENPYPPVVAAVAQNLSVFSLSRQEGRSAQDVLLLRARDKDSPLAAGMASECLLGAFLLASEKKAPRAIFVAAIEDFAPGDDASLVSRVALLAGLAWCWDGSEDVEESLKRLAQDTDWGGQAAFELGMIEIDCGLCSQDKESLFARLQKAVAWFEKAESIEPEMLEATAFRATLRALMLFCEGGAAKEVELLIEDAREAASERFDYLDTSSMREWLRPRLDVQTTWYELSCALHGLSKYMTERSWLRALPVLQQVANLRSTLVKLSTSSGDALRDTITGRLASGFVAREGLRAHLQDWANDGDIGEANREHALALIAAVERMRADQGKVAPLASEDGLASGASLDKTLAEIDSLLPGAWRQKPLTWMQEKCVAKIFSELVPNEDYGGSIRADVNQFVVFLIRFLTHCLNVGYDISNKTFSFLFKNGVGLPLEKEMQAAMFHWLHLMFEGFESHKVIREAHDVARGRADLAIVCDGWRMVAELKRELTDASRAGLTKYLGQPATYQIDGPRISFLIVLDLCSQRTWPLTLDDNCWVETVQTVADSVPRMVVVFRIPGLRPVPSRIVTPKTGLEKVKQRVRKTDCGKASKPSATKPRTKARRSAVDPDSGKA